MVLLILACDAEPELPTEGEIELLSYNVHGLPEAITGDETAQRIEQIAPLLGGYDFVGLQEDWREEDHEVLLAGSDYAEDGWFDETVDGHVYGSGLAYLSQMEVIELDEVHYNSCNGVTDGASDCLASKGYQRVRVLLGGGYEVDIYNTHFEAGGGDEDDAVRTAQVDMVLEAFERDSAGFPIVFLGDTNLNDDDPEDLVEVLKLKDYGLEDACDLVGCPEPGRIDRVMLLSDGGVSFTAQDWEIPAEFVDSEGVELSDHDPIHVGVAWSFAGD